MALPLLAVFAATLGAQQFVQGRARERATAAEIQAKQQAITQQRGTVAAALNQGLITQQEALAGDAVAQQGIAAQTNSFLRGMITESRNKKEFVVTSTETAASNRSQREDRDRRFLLTKRAEDAALNPEIQTALAAADALGRLSVTNRTVIDGATGEIVHPPRRGQPGYNLQRDRVRETSRGLRNTNELMQLIQDLPSGQILDPASPAFAQIANRYENLLAFGRKEQNLGTPQGKETARQERANPNGTSFVRALQGSKAATLASLSITQETLKLAAEESLRDSRNLNLDRIDTDESLLLIAQAANQLEVTANIVGSDPSRAFGAEGPPPGGTVTQFRTGVDLAVELAKLAADETFTPGRTDATRRLRQIQQVGADVFGNPDIPLFIPDVLPKRVRELLGVGAAEVDLPFVD